MIDGLQKTTKILRESEFPNSSSAILAAKTQLQSLQSVVLQCSYCSQCSYFSQCSYCSQCSQGFFQDFSQGGQNEI